LFLRHDALVLPGWLEPLYRTLESDPSIAVVQPQRLDPDGTLPEIGNACCTERNTLEIDPGNPTAEGPLHTACEAYAPMGAAMLVRGDFWRAIAGSGEYRNPAGHEAFDLAVTARERGLRIVCEPASEIVRPL
jgi:GT2 family glycosyltransferase